MKTIFATIALTIAFPAAAYAQSAPAPEKKCCCCKDDEKMECCKDKVSADAHAGHSEGKPAAPHH